MSQDKLTRTERLLGAATEAELIEPDLDLVRFRDEVVTGVRRLAGSRSLRKGMSE